jgi:hypothetical protein
MLACDFFHADCVAAADAARLGGDRSREASAPRAGGLKPVGRLYNDEGGGYRHSTGITSGPANKHRIEGQGPGPSASVVANFWSPAGCGKTGA